MITCAYVVGVHKKETRKVWKGTNVCDSARAAMMQCHRLDSLTTGIDYLTLLEARSSRSRCQPCRFLLRPLSFTYRCLSSSCVFTWSPLCVLISSFFKKLIYFNWRLITLQYCSVFCHPLTWINHGCTCVPHPELPSHLSPHLIPQGHSSAPALNTLSHASGHQSHWIRVHPCDLILN